MILGSRNKRWLNLVASDNQGRKHDLPAGPKPQESRTKPPPLPRRPTHGLPILTIVLKLYTVPLGWDSEPVSSYMKINDEDDDDGVKDSPRQYPGTMRRTFYYRGTLLLYPYCTNSTNT